MASPRPTAGAQTAGRPPREGEQGFLKVWRGRGGGGRRGNPGTHKHAGTRSETQLLDIWRRDRGGVKGSQGRGGILVRILASSVGIPTHRRRKEGVKTQRRRSSRNTS
jgi:hypothetical protein